MLPAEQQRKCTGCGTSDSMYEWPSVSAGWPGVIPHLVLHSQGRAMWRFQRTLCLIHAAIHTSRLLHEFFCEIVERKQFWIRGYSQGAGSQKFTGISNNGFLYNRGQGSCLQQLDSHRLTVCHINAVIFKHKELGLTRKVPNIDWAVTMQKADWWSRNTHSKMTIPPPPLKYRHHDLNKILLECITHCISFLTCFWSYP